MDLSQYDTRVKSAAGVAMTVEHPVSGDPFIDPTTGQPATITLLGIDAPAFRKARELILEQRFAKMDDERRARHELGFLVPLTVEEITEDAIECCVAATVNWSHIEQDGKPLPFSKVNARMLFRCYPWIGEQAFAFISDRSQYFE